MVRDGRWLIPLQHRLMPPAPTVVSIRPVPGAAAGSSHRNSPRSTQHGLPRSAAPGRDRSVDGGWLPGPRGGRRHLLGHPQQRPDGARLRARPSPHERRDHSPEERPRRHRSSEHAGAGQELGQVCAHPLCCGCCGCCGCGGCGGHGSSLLPGITGSPECCLPAAEIATGTSACTRDASGRRDGG